MLIERWICDFEIELTKSFQQCCISRASEERAECEELQVEKQTDTQRSPPELRSQAGR